MCKYRSIAGKKCMLICTLAATRESAYKLQDVLPT
uniref:Uncharacterized protein n=1 Tax=Anguilla anguilla TaxID=7936 RepID=A0A0E9R5R9_ANGAN